MRKIIYSLLFILVLTSCKKAEEKNGVQNARIELIPEPDQVERLKYEALLKLKKTNCTLDEPDTSVNRIDIRDYESAKKTNCTLDEPDTSVNGIDIRDYESAKKLIGEKDKMDDLGQYHLYSNLERETLTLVQHPGDIKYQISIFKVENSSKESFDYQQVKIDTFKTGKGIKLGMNKREIIKKLGKCYAAIDSTKNYIELYYRIELPSDSKSKLLKNSNMPIYYASYKLCRNKLEKFEFGFEYP